MVDLDITFGQWGHYAEYIVRTDNLDEAILQLQGYRRKEKLSKVNKLAKSIYGSRLDNLDDEKIDKLVKNKGCSGKTTAQALAYLVEAIQNPGKAVELKSDTCPDSGLLNMGMFNVVKELAKKLEFKFLVFRESSRTVTFEI